VLDGQVGDFEARVAHDDCGRVVVVVRGQLDCSTADTFKSTVVEAMDGCTRLEIDLRETTFMDSSGLAIIAWADRRLGPDRQPIVVRDPSPLIRRVLDITGISALVEIQLDHSQA
jgi:anti-anti-sigma factor